VLEEVEKIRSRLKSKPLPELELPSQRQIDLGSVESAKGTSSQISVDRPGLYRECRGIDFLFRRLHRGLQSGVVFREPDSDALGRQVASEAIP
jgi:hypothetical protein